MHAHYSACVCMHIYMYVCVYICIYIYVCVYVIYTNIYICFKLLKSSVYPNWEQPCYNCSVTTGGWWLPYWIVQN